jgi:hypothetical protein
MAGLIDEDVALEHLVEAAAVFDGEKALGADGGESVLEGVAGAAGLAFGCARAGGLLGVAAVCGDLFVGSHFGFPISIIRVPLQIPGAVVAAKAFRVWGVRRFLNFVNAIPDEVGFLR